MLFNEYGLWKWNLSDPPTPVSSTSEPTETSLEKGEDASTLDHLNKGYWSLVKSATEEDIFEELGMDYVDPTKRNFSFVSGKSRTRRKSSLVLR